MKRLGLSGAELIVGIRLSNPNAFSLTLEGMQYQLMADGQPWASGETGQRISLPQKGDDLLEIPISLDFIRMGQAVYQSLAEGRRLDYQFRGDLDLTASLPLLGRTHLPFEQLGQIAVLK
jgi:LEA14-like dessication related protein